MSSTPATMPSVSTTADAALGVVRAVLEVAASPERVFRALTDPKELETWWGAPDMYRTHDWVLDLRPGGKWHCQATGPDGNESTVRGEYITIDPPRLLEYTWQPSWEGFMNTRVRIELDTIPNGTRLRLEHSGFTSAKACENHTAGWTRVLTWLGGHMTRR